MSTNEKMFREAARAYADRHEAIRIRFGHKGKEVLAIVSLRDDWTKSFHFDGDDGVSIKDRLSEEWDKKISTEAFAIAYGGGGLSA